MKLPQLGELTATQDMIDAFGGYNHNLRIGNGEFFDMKNLTSSYYPVLSTRAKRGEYASPTSPQGLARYDNLCYVDGANLIVNKKPVEMELSTAAEDCPKQLIRMGAYLVILPDKKWINLASEGFTDKGDIEAVIGHDTGKEVSVSFEMCKVDGSDYESVEKGASAPENTDAMWLDTSTKPHSLKQYSKSLKDWTTVPTVYVKMTFTGFTSDSPIPFSEGDGVTISGIVNNQLSDLNNTMVVWARGDDYIVVTGLCDELVTQESGITVSRLMPTMDFVTESENRLWGCRYGIAKNGEMVNEIYASKLGDFKNWNVFHTPSVSTDSYVVQVGTDGHFTGAATHLGYPLFFKENYMHKVYGNYPSNYQMQTTACRGVQRGSHKSLAIVNEVLYYKSRGAVCSYDGSLPQEVSYNLGETAYSDAVAGSHGNKYYISMKDDSGVYSLFVYDTARGMWHKEDSTRVDDFCSCRDELYYIDNEDKKIKTMFGSGTTDNTAFDWMAETGIIGVEDPTYKYISKLNLRMSMEKGTTVRVYAQYDSWGDWHQLFQMNCSSMRSFTVPIRPNRCDHLRLRIEGTGQAKIFSISKTIEQGSDWK